jgi:hypothetical protein
MTKDFYHPSTRDPFLKVRRWWTVDKRCDDQIELYDKFDPTTSPSYVETELAQLAQRALINCITAVLRST